MASIVGQFPLAGAGFNVGLFFERLVCGFPLPPCSMRGVKLFAASGFSLPRADCHIHEALSHFVLFFGLSTSLATGTVVVARRFLGASKLPLRHFLGVRWFCPFHCFIQICLHPSFSVSKARYISAIQSGTY